MRKRKLADRDWELDVHEVMQQRGWTRAELAEAVGVSVDTVHSWLKPGAASHRAPGPLHRGVLSALRWPGSCIVRRVGHVDVMFVAPRG